MKYKVNMEVEFKGEKICENCPLHKVDRCNTSWIDQWGMVHNNGSQFYHCGIPFPAHIIMDCPLVPIREGIFSRIRAYLRNRKEQRKERVER